jgi:hypothetical protein
MSGRGDNNKHGSSGQGSSNQSNQGFKGSEQASNHNKKHTGAVASKPQEKTKDGDSDRNAGVPTEKLSGINTQERTLNIILDSVPYLINVSPFSFNEEMRFYVSVNGGEQHVFTWDSEVGGLRAIDDEASTLPVGLEEAISEKLQA